MHATFNIAQELRAQIDEINDWVYTDVNNGVYKCGFSTTQVWLLHFFLAPTAGKHQKQILHKLTKNQIIQPGPVDLGILCHFVSIYGILVLCNTIVFHNFLWSPDLNDWKTIKSKCIVSTSQYTTG